MLTNNYKLSEVLSKLSNVIKTPIDATQIKTMWSVPQQIPVDQKMVSLVHTYPKDAIFYDLNNIYKSDWKNIFRIIILSKNMIIFYKEKDNYLIIKDKKIIKDKSDAPIDFIKKILYSINNPVDYNITSEEIWFKDYLKNTGRLSKFNLYMRAFKTSEIQHKKTRFIKNLEIVTDNLDLIDKELVHNDYYNEDFDTITYKKQTLTNRQIYFYRLQLLFYLKDSTDTNIIRQFKDDYKAVTFIEACKKIINKTYTLDEICDCQIVETIISPDYIDYVCFEELQDAYKSTHSLAYEGE